MTEPTPAEVMLTPSESGAGEREARPVEPAPREPLRPQHNVWGDASSFAPGVVLVGRYRLEAALDGGGQGVVWSAFDLASGTGERVAVKVLHANADAEARARFGRERDLMRSLAGRHRNIVAFRDTGTLGEVPFLVMDLAEGRPLRDIIGDGLPIGRALNIAREIAEALGAAHRASVIHRDVNPRNVLVDEHNRIWLLDFGLAKSLLGTTRTQVGMAGGLPGYGAPEQLAGALATADHRADIYGLGAVLFHMLTGRAPFVGEDRKVVALRQNGERAPRLTDIRPERPWGAPLEALLASLLEMDPERRPPDMTVVVERLDTLIAYGLGHTELRWQRRAERAVETWTSGPRAWALGALLVAAGIVLTVVAVSRPTLVAEPMPVQGSLMVVGMEGSRPVGEAVIELVRPAGVLDVPGPDHLEYQSGPHGLEVRRAGSQDWQRVAPGASTFVRGPSMTLTVRYLATPPSR